MARSHMGVVFAACIASLLAAGCKGGGESMAAILQSFSIADSTLANLGIGSDTTVDQLAALFENGDIALPPGEDEKDGDNDVPDAVLAHSPEPGTTVLFGGGLMAAAWSRRRAKRRAA